MPSIAYVVLVVREKLHRAWYPLTPHKEGGGAPGPAGQSGPAANAGQAAVAR